MFVVHFRALFVENSRMVWYASEFHGSAYTMASERCVTCEQGYMYSRPTYIHERTEGGGTA